MAINRGQESHEEAAQAVLEPRETIRAATNLRGSDPLAKFLQEANILDPVIYDELHPDTSVNHTHLQMMPLIIESTRKKHSLQLPSALLTNRHPSTLAITPPCPDYPLP